MKGDGVVGYRELSRFGCGSAVVVCLRSEVSGGTMFKKPNS